MFRQALHLVQAVVAHRLNREQSAIIDHRREENRVLRERPVEGGRAFPLPSLAL